MATPPSSLRLRPVAAGHAAARRYLQARRNALSRDDRVIAIAGLWGHQQSLRLGATIETFLWCPGDRPDGAVTGTVEELIAAAGSSYQISERTLARLHPGGQAPGLLSVVRIPTWTSADLVGGDAGVLLVADGVEYAGNLGSLVRTVDASGADGLIITNPVGRLSHPSVFSASRGTVLTTPSLQPASVGEAGRTLQAAGFEIVVADPAGAISHREAWYGGRHTAIVVGSEGSGVSAEWRALADRRVSIPMLGRADSLNVATAAAILLFDRLAFRASPPTATFRPPTAARPDRHPRRQ